MKVNQAKRPVYTGEARSILPIHDGSMGSRDRYRAEQGYFLIFVLHAWMHGRNGAIKSRRFAFVSRMLFEKINNTSPDGTIGFLFFLFFFISPPPLHEDGRGSNGKGEAVSRHQFFRKKCRDTWPPPRRKGRRGPRHENATFYGFIMRMVDQGTNGWDET